MKPGVILSMEQALSLTSATLRFVHLGWRVIKLEATPQSEGALPGDPNRYIGSLVADEGRRSYFIGPNVGKESIALNLKSREGRDVLHRLIRELNVDVFCCNTLPSRYSELGIDYDSLRAVKPDLIWAAISAMGPDYPDAAGYDPAIQAQVGYMEVTGMLDGPPTLAGIPLVDLKAGDEVYANVWKALAERATSGQGSRIDVSMMQAAAAWLITLLPLIDFDCEPWEITRAGNEHRKFVPTNAYPTSGRRGAVRHRQRRRLAALHRDTEIQCGGHAAARHQCRPRRRPRRHPCRYCRHHQAAFHRRHDRRPQARKNSARADQHRAAGDADRGHRQAADDHHRARRPACALPPMAVDQAGAPQDFSFPPRYGEHSEKILREVGYDLGAIAKLREAHVIAGPDAVVARS